MSKDSQENTWGGLSFSKNFALCMLGNLLDKTLYQRCFLVNFTKYFNIIFYRTPLEICFYGNLVYGTLQELSCLWYKLIPNCLKDFLVYFLNSHSKNNKCTRESCMLPFSNFYRTILKRSRLKALSKIAN